MKRSLLSGGIGIAVLAVTIPAGAVIQNQVSRPRVEAQVEAAALVDLPTTTSETATTRPEATEPPKTEPTRPTTTEAAPEPKPVRPVEPKPVDFVLRLECGTRMVDNAVMNVCHWGEPNVGGVKGYKVWRAIGDGAREVIGRTEGHEWSERNVKAGVRYAYAVEAVGEGGTSLGYSNKAVVAAHETPLAPRLNCVSKVVETQLGVVCEWTPVKRDGARAYQLWRKVGDGARELLTTVPADGPRRFFDTNVQRGQHFVYTVVAVDVDGTVIIGSAAVRVVISIETLTTIVKPVETTRPADSEPKSTVGD
ncbi:MAG TPA: hypothetical protein VM282_04110 [Acidimicrobiales bacterium]|nr:hypothetical protein [Acidimicrobiales bacterium]